LNKNIDWKWNRWRCGPTHTSYRRPYCGAEY